jgi:hypothetical protein
MCVATRDALPFLRNNHIVTLFQILLKRSRIYQINIFFLHFLFFTVTEKQRENTDDAVPLEPKPKVVKTTAASGKLIKSRRKGRVED